MEEEVVEDEAVPGSVVAMREEQTGAEERKSEAYGGMGRGF